MAASNHPVWAWLPKDLLALVLNKLPNFSGFVRFISVCAPWRYVALEDTNDHQHRLIQKQKQKLRILKTCGNQLPMLMISVKNDSNKILLRHDLYCSTDKKIYGLGSTLPYGNRFCGSSHGWLFTIEKNRVVTLLNPLTSQTIRLPRFRHPSHDDEFELWIDDFEYLIVKGILSSDPGLNPDDYEVVVIFNGMRRLAYFKSGDAAWTFVHTEKDHVFSDLAYHKGQLYGVNHWTGVVHIDLASGTHKIVIRPSWPIAMATSLVESQEGDL